MHKFVLILLFCLNGFSFDFKGCNIFNIEKIAKESPSGDREEIGILSLVEFSKDRYLILLNKRIFKQFRKPSILSEVEKQKKEGKALIKTSEPPEVENKVYLAFVKKNGKVIMEGDELEIGFEESNYLKPFAEENIKSCPYGFISKEQKKLYCFDYNLKLKSNLDIPLDELLDYKIDFDGKNYRLWVFGYDDKTIGKIYSFKENKWTNFSIGLNDIYEAVSIKAKDPNNEKVKLSKNSLKINMFNEELNKSNINLIVYADEKKLEKENFFEGRRHFFKLVIDEFGYINVERLNLWFEFKDIDDVIFDKENGILTLPSFFDEKRFLTIPFGNSFFIHIDGSLSFPDKEFNYNTEAPYLYFGLFYFSNSSSVPEYSHNYPEIRKKLQAFNDDEIKTVFPILKYIGGKKFFFPALCYVDSEKNKSERCYVEAEFFD